MREWRRRVCTTQGTDRRLAFVGGPGSGDMTGLGLIIPTAGTPDYRHRYLYALESADFSEGEEGRLVGFKQLLTMGALVSEPLGTDPGPRTNVVQNGDFSTVYHWGCDPLQWTIGGGVATFHYNPAGGAPVLWQPCLTTDCTFSCTFTIVSQTAGNLQVLFGNTWVGTFTGPGTYTVSGVASNPALTFGGDATCDAVIDDVSAVCTLVPQTGTPPSILRECQVTSPIWNMPDGNVIWWLMICPLESPNDQQSIVLPYGQSIDPFPQMPSLLVDASGNPLNGGMPFGDPIDQYGMLTNVVFPYGHKYSGENLKIDLRVESALDVKLSTWGKIKALFK